MKSLRINQVALGLVVAAMVIVATSCQDNLADADVQGAGAAVQATITLSGSLTTQTLTSNNTYILDGFVSVPNGEVLTIQAGTVIKGETGTLAGDPASGTPPGTLIIERGGQIQAVGTATSPIVFTSNEASPAAGDWGGVVILGNAPVCYAGNPTIEGIPNNLGVDNNYGGSTPGDNSGTLQYVRIGYAGNVLVDGNETNGLTLGGVGSGTTIDHVQVTHGSDDGFEFFGGTVNASYVIASYNTDDDFDTDQGYSGHIQFGVSFRDPSVASSVPTSGFESNGDDDDDDGCDLTNATFSNFTIIGPIGPSNNSIAANYRSGVNIRDGSELDLFNSLITGYPEYQLTIEAAYLGNYDDDNNDATDNLVSIEDVTLVFPSFHSSSPSYTNIAPADFLIAGYNNEIVNANTVGISGAGTLPAGTGLDASAWSPSSVLDFQPNTQKAAHFDNDLLDDPYIDDAVAFRGAIGASDVADWDSGWEVF